ILDRVLNRASGGECLGELRVHIGDVKQQRDRRSAERLWPVVAHLGRLVREHYNAVADLDLGVPDLAAWRGKAHHLGRADGFFIEVERRSEERRAGGGDVVWT